MPGEDPALPIRRGKSRETNLRDSDKEMGTERLLARLRWTHSSPLLKVIWALSTSK